MFEKVIISPSFTKIFIIWEAERLTERESSYLLVHSPKAQTDQGLGQTQTMAQAEARSLELNPGLPHMGGRDTSTWTMHLLSTRVCISKKLELGTEP